MDGACDDNAFEFRLYDSEKGGKTADEIISMLMNFFESGQIHEDDHVVMYADNCAGQNKNKYLVAFLVIICHVMKKCASIRLKFLLVGHSQSV